MITTVPFINGINIKEHTILFSSEELSLRANNKYLCKATINNISPYMLETKIEEILKENRNINFYQVQYNEKNKELIFYTFETLINNRTTNTTKESLKNQELYNYYEEIQKEFENLNSIDSMLPLKNENTVSLQDIINTFYIMNQEYENQKNKTQEQLDKLLAKRETKEKLDSYIKINFEENEIEYRYEFYNTSIYYTYYIINIKIINNKLFITNFEKKLGNEEEEQNQKKKIIENYEKVKEIITNILKYKGFKTETEQIIQSINSKIILNINNNLGAYNVYYKNKNPNFSIEINKDKPIINSKSLELYYYLLENLDDIKEQLFFRKMNCPVWMQEYWENNKKEETVSKEKIIEPIQGEKTNENGSLETANQKVKSRWSFFSQYF